MKLDVTETDILKTCDENSIERPYLTVIDNSAVQMHWTGDRSADAMRLFFAGLGKHWQFDNNSDTEEFSVKVDNGGPTAFRTVAKIMRR